MCIRDRNEPQKRGIILKDVIDLNPDFAVLIDTRMVDDLPTRKSLIRTENYHFEICGSSAGEKGIIILIKNSNNITITNVIKDPNGQYIILEPLHELRPLLIVGVYGPSDTDDPDFWTVLIEKIKLLAYENYILIGDVNFVLNVELDTQIHKRTQFCAGWLKCFWPILGKFLFNAIMTSKNKENPEMSPVMRMALITLIPKGDKAVSYTHLTLPTKA